MTRPPPPRQKLMTGRGCSCRTCLLMASIRADAAPGLDEGSGDPGLREAKACSKGARGRPGTLPDTA